MANDTMSIAEDEFRKEFVEEQIKNSRLSEMEFALKEENLMLRKVGMEAKSPELKQQTKRNIATNEAKLAELKTYRVNKERKQASEQFNKLPQEEKVMIALRMNGSEKAQKYLETVDVQQFAQNIGNEETKIGKMINDTPSTKSQKMAIDKDKAIKHEIDRRGKPVPQLESAEEFRKRMEKKREEEKEKTKALERRRNEVRKIEPSDVIN
jgi:hypothetical protein